MFKILKWNSTHICLVISIMAMCVILYLQSDIIYFSIVTYLSNKSNNLLLLNEYIYLSQVVSLIFCIFVFTPLILAFKSKNFSYVNTVLVVTLSIFILLFLLAILLSSTSLLISLSILSSSLSVNLLVYSLVLSTINRLWAFSCNLILSGVKCSP